MGSPNTIIIKNRTGIAQSYQIFAGTPAVGGGTPSGMRSHVYQSSGRTPNGATVKFTLSREYYAAVGTKRGSESGSQVTTVASVKPVALGVSNPDGTLTPGTTLDMVVAEGVPTFGDEPTEPSGWSKSFAVRTHGDFSSEEAREREFFLGVTTSPDDPTTSVLMSFSPEPNVVYNIHPADKFYVTAGGHFQVGSAIDVSEFGGATVAVDFTQLGRTVNIVHDETGRLTLVA